MSGVRARFRNVSAKSRELTLLTGRWTGAGAAVPTKVGVGTAAVTGRGMTLTRSGVGALTLTLDETWPVIQASHITVHAVVRKQLVITPVTAAGVYAIQVETPATDVAAAVAVDLAAADELQVLIAASYTGNP